MALALGSRLSALGESISALWRESSSCPHTNPVLERVLLHLHLSAVGPARSCPPGMEVMAAKPLSDPAAKPGLETRDHTLLIPCRMRGSWFPLVVLISHP